MGDESEFAQATEWFQRVTHDPMADASPGRLTVVSASDPERRGRYQDCRLELAAEVEGAAPVAISYTGVFDRRHWPRAGTVVPAQISRSDPAVFEADWSRL